MLGIIVDGKGNTEGEPINKIFYTFGKKSSIERVLDAAVRCDYAHKVILSMPSADRSLINGSLFQTKLLRPTESFMGRSWTPHFSQRHDEDLGRLYHAALNHQLSHVVRISANNLFIPTWLISAVIEFYFENGAQSYTYTSDTYPKGFEIEAFPFWMLAKAYTALDAKIDADELSKYLLELPGKSVPNVEPHNLPTPLNKAADPISFKLSDHTQLPLFSRLCEEIDAGADIGKILEDIDE